MSIYLTQDELELFATLQLTPIEETKTLWESLEPACNPFGYTMTPEHRALIGLKHKGKVVSEETRKKLSESRKKLKGTYTEEHRQKLREAKLRNPLSAESIAKMLKTRAEKRAAKLAAQSINK